MRIDKEIKKKLKESRMKQLESRYFDLEMDRISFEAIGNFEDAKLIAKRMEDVKKAYEAIEAID